jgi:hypothetical protein
MTCIPTCKDETEWVIIIAVLDDAREQLHYQSYQRLVYAAQRLLENYDIPCYPDKIHAQIERLINDGYLLDASKHNPDGTPMKQIAKEALLKLNKVSITPNNYYISEQGKKALDQMNGNSKQFRAVEPVLNDKSPSLVETTSPYAQARSIAIRLGARGISEKRLKKRSEK